MKVKQLVEKLQKLNQEAEIVCSDEYSEDTFDITHVGDTYIQISFLDPEDEDEGDLEEDDE